MTSRRAQQQNDIRFQVMRLLHDNPELSTRQLAEAVSISNGAAYYMVKALLQKGLIKLGNFSGSKHKHRYAYVLTLKGLSVKTRMTARFLSRKRKEFEALKLEIEGLERDAKIQKTQISLDMRD